MLRISSGPSARRELTSPVLHRELRGCAALQPRYDFTDPIAARRRVRFNVSVAAAAGFWRRDHPDVEWVDWVLPDTTVKVRVYTPRGSSSPTPAIIYVHGGGFVVGDLDIEHPRCLELCHETSARVVSVDYRLAPEHRYPAALDDCGSALDWLLRYGESLKVDTRRVVMVGASAGGCLAAATSLRRRDRGEPLPCFQMLIYPVLDDRLSTASMATCTKTPLWDAPNSALMWAHYLGPSCDRSATPQYASPARCDSLAASPPTYIMAADQDPLRDEALEFGRRLLEAGVPTELHLYPGTFHGFDTVGDSSISRAARHEQYRALRTALYDERRSEGGG